MLLSSGGGTGDTGLYTVRGVGSGSLDVDAWTQTSLYAEDRGLPSTDDPGACQNKCFFRSYGLLNWSTLNLSGNKTHLLNDSEMCFTVGVLSRRILDYGLVKAERDTNLV
jgi:hypothetical protein